MDNSATTTSSSKHQSFELVQTFERSEEIAQQMIESARICETVIGVDCEGILRGRPLCLIQMYFEGCTYIFDLLEINPFRGLLREVLESKEIIKVFHDFCEDAASLISHYGVQSERIFDTQIAHRLLSNYTNPSKLTENNSISLNKLLKTYLELSNELKDYMSDKLKSNITLWEKRPLSDEMISYAAQDVCYLPTIYQVFCAKVTKLKSSIEGDLINDVFKDSRKCNIYAYINMNCKNFMSCKIGQYLTAFLKNFQKFCIYCGLNLGCTGIVLDQKSIKFIKTYFQMGDMLNLEISRIDIEDKKIILKVPEYYLNMDPETIANYCFYAKSQNEKKLTRDFINIYCNKKPQIKTNLKLTGKTFFSKSALNVRDRTYSGSESIEMPCLETATKYQLKSSESIDNLMNKFEEEKKPSHTDQIRDESNEAVTEEVSEVKTKMHDAKKFIHKAPETFITPAPKSKKIPKSQNQNKRKNKKNKDFSNWIYI